MAKKILVGVLTLLVVLVIIVAMQPATYRVERSAELQTPPASAFMLVSDFRNFDMWSPWNELDPNMKKTYSDPSYGVGASYAWDGNDQVGRGKMTVTKFVSSSTYETRLEFMAPTASTARSGFDIVGAGAGSKVTWWVEGEKNFMAKAFGLVMNMDKMIGDTYVKGLANLAGMAPGFMAQPGTEVDAPPASAADAAAAKIAEATAAAGQEALARAAAGRVAAEAAAAEAAAGVTPTRVTP